MYFCVKLGDSTLNVSVDAESLREVRERAAQLITEVEEGHHGKEEREAILLLGEILLQSDQVKRKPFSWKMCALNIFLLFEPYGVHENFNIEIDVV